VTVKQRRQTGIGERKKKGHKEQYTLLLYLSHLKHEATVMSIYDTEKGGGCSQYLEKKKKEERRRRRRKITQRVCSFYNTKYVKDQIKSYFMCHTAHEEGWREGKQT
jgi:predicted GNAT family acetyltransferase